MLEHELERLELLLAQSNDLLPLRRGKAPYLIEMWEEANGCFLPADLVALYAWADGEEAQGSHFYTHYEPSFPLHNYSFVPFSQAVTGGEHGYHLREFLIECDLGDWNTFSRFVRPLFNLQEPHLGDGSNTDAHIFVPCHPIRKKRAPFVIDEGWYGMDLPRFLCDDVRAFVRCWCLYLEKGRISRQDWLALNPFSAFWNERFHGRNTDFCERMWPWKAPWPWEIREQDDVEA